MKLLDDRIRFSSVFRLEPSVKVLADCELPRLLPRRTAYLEEKTSGRIKLSNAQSSCRLFCRGVPVMSILPREVNVRMI